MDQTGLLSATRYAYPPNRLFLCGPKKQSDLLGFVAGVYSNTRATQILSEFKTFYPYLKLIAQANKLKDPFDPRVVEAYWIGNSYLKNVKLRSFYTYLTDGLELRKKLSFRQKAEVDKKLDKGGLPHHAFHVVNVYVRTGHTHNRHTLATMDACLINWGQVKGVSNETLVVNSQKLTIIGNRLRLMVPITRRLETNLGDGIKVGDWVAYHWGMVCEKLSPTKLAHLKYYTQKALLLSNPL